MLTQLPEELIAEVYRHFFSSYVIAELNKCRCFTKHYTDVAKKSSVSCMGAREPNKYYCIGCRCGVIDYY